MLHGSMVALVTPMAADNQIDWSSLHNLVEWHLEKGSDAIVVAGTTGESATLTMEENKAIITAVVDQVAGRVPVIAGTGSNSTHEAVELTQSAKDSGADACLLVCPYYNKPTQEGLFRHHEFIAKTVAIPQILYNVPGRTVVDMQHDTVIRLSKVKNIIGIKEATGDMQRAKKLVEDVPQDFLLLSGDDATAKDFMLLGGHGVISVVANVVPTEFAELCKLAVAGQDQAAKAVDDRLQPLNKALFLESNPIPVKWALQQMGLIPSGIRLPLTPLAERYHEPLRAVMRELQLL